MSPFVLLLLAGLLIAGLVYLLIRDPHPLPDPPVPLRAVADAPDGEPCKLVGLAQAADGEPLVQAPFGALDVLYHHTRLEVLAQGDEQAPRLLLEQRRGVQQLLLEDDSGRALVTLSAHERSPAVRFAASSRKTLQALPMAQVASFLASAGKRLEDFPKDLPADAAELPGTLRVVQERIMAGERVVAVGRARQRPSLDGRRPSVLLSGDQHTELFLCNDEEAIAQLARQALAGRS